MHAAQARNARVERFFLARLALSCPESICPWGVCLSPWRQRRCCAASRDGLWIVRLRSSLGGGGSSSLQRIRRTAVMAFDISEFVLANRRIFVWGVFFALGGVIVNSGLFPLFFITFILCFLFKDAIEWLSTRTRCPRRLTTVLVYLFFLALLVTILSFVVPRLVKEAAHFLRQTPEAIEKIHLAQSTATGHGHQQPQDVDFPRAPAGHERRDPGDHRARLLRPHHGLGLLLSDGHAVQLPHSAGPAKHALPSRQPP